MKKDNMYVYGVGMLLLMAVFYTAWVGLFTLPTKDTYTAEVIRPVHVGTHHGQVAEFIGVEVIGGPDSPRTIVGNTLRLKITDVRRFPFVYETVQDRFSNLSKGDIICITDVSFRSSLLSKYPLAVSYTDGACE